MILREGVWGTSQFQTAVLIDRTLVAFSFRFLPICVGLEKITRHNRNGSCRVNFFKLEIEIIAPAASETPACSQSRTVSLPLRRPRPAAAGSPAEAGAHALRHSNDPLRRVRPRGRLPGHFAEAAPDYRSGGESSVRFERDR